MGCAMAEVWYRLNKLPDLTLNKYASLEGRGVDGVLEKHIAFLRQLNRKGIVSGLSFHLYYLYIVPNDPAKDRPGHRLQIFFLIKGKPDAVDSVKAMMDASPLSSFFEFSTKYKSNYPGSSCSDGTCSIRNVLSDNGIDYPSFTTCSFLTKTETLLSASNGEAEDYYMIRDWEMNEDGRLYNMCKIMEALNHTVLYRVDLYPVEKSISLREALRKPMGFLRKKQEERGGSSRKDYDGKDVLDNYEDLIEKYDSSPHFITNIMVMASSKEDAITVLDAAGSESLMKGKYSISTFFGDFAPQSFLDLDPEFEGLDNLRDNTVVRKGRPGLIICRQDTANINLNYLPTLFSLEEMAPFFRFPALYDGETIQLAKETAPSSVGSENALFLGKDENGYDVNFPLELLPKHAFISGVPGSGKTNTMHHITSSLWEKKIPFLVLEPAKQEYRALLNDPKMKDVYLFSPNADMSFPLHINPFEMPKGTMVAEHIRRLCSVFEGSFPLDNPMPFLLDTAIEAVYRELGWIPEHVYTGDEKVEGTDQKRPLPSMSMLYRRLEQELKSTQYSDEVRGNLESALKVRIGSLLRREMGDVFDVPRSTFEPEKWLEVPAVIELESMGSGPANFLTLMLCALIRETLKAHPHYDGPVRHVIFIEEAHNLIGPESEEQSGGDGDPKQAATAFVVKMLAEVRALKEGIVIADQLPTVMAQEVLKNTGLKLGLRITSADDRSLLGSTMAASGMQLEQMSTFAVGEALIFYEKLMRPFTMRIHKWRDDIKDDAEWKFATESKNDKDLQIAISNLDTYQEENITSVEIILDKFRLKMKELNDATRKYVDTISVIGSSLKDYNELYDYLMDVALEKKTASDERINELHDKLLQSEMELTDWFIKNKHVLMGPAESASSVSEWIFALERLRKGRWARFGMSKGLKGKVISLESEMISEVKELSLCYEPLITQINAMGKPKETEMRRTLWDVIRKSTLRNAMTKIIGLMEKNTTIDFQSKED